MNLNGKLTCRCDDQCSDITNCSRMKVTLHDRKQKCYCFTRSRDRWSDDVLAREDKGDGQLLDGRWLYVTSLTDSLKQRSDKFQLLEWLLPGFLLWCSHVLGGVAVDEHFLLWDIVFIAILYSSFLGVWFVPFDFLFQCGLVTYHLWLLHDFLSELLLFIAEFTAMT